MSLSSVQLARLVQAYLAAPGFSIEEKAVRVGVRRNELLRAARGTISRTARVRLLAYFATVETGRAGGPGPGSAGRPRRQRKRGFT